MKIINRLMQRIKSYSLFINENVSTNKSDIDIDDYVEVINYDDLTEKQLAYLKSKKLFRVFDIITKNNKEFIDVGYKIPLKAERFKLVDVFSSYKYKVLFISFDFKINFYGEKDTNNLFKNSNTTRELFTDLFEEKSKDVFVNFCRYEDIYRQHNDFYLDNNSLKDYDYIFFGFMANYTTLSTMLINYVTKHNIPHMKYETYNHFHNKAYQFDLLDSLGYPYIPSIMTTKINKNIYKTIEEFGYPVIVKDVFLDRGEGVWKINNEEELLKTFAGNTKLMLIQKFIPNDGEYRVITIKNKVVLVAKKDSIEDVNKKLIDSRKSKKGELPQDVLKMCEDISTHLFSDIIGFDIIQDSNTKKYYVIETNASPHFSMFSVVTNVSVPEIIVNTILKEIK
jgi:glutathione synthase/RimK-type ligase-like ATP-grasp enzyme